MFAGTSALGAAALSGRAWADAPAAVRSVAFSPVGQGVRLAVALERPSEHRTMFLVTPDRFVVDIANAHWSLPQGATGEGQGAGLVRRYRYAPREGGTARLVLDLEGPANLLRQEIGSRQAPTLTFDLAPNLPLTTAPPPFEVSGGRRTIVIDAGHGGRDPGAIGATGVREKDVVLDAALQLRRALEARGRYRVALTRETDEFVELEQRVNFARAQRADLFISLHADSHANHDAHGAAVYTLSERGADRAQTIMTAQDWDLDLGQSPPRDAIVGDILVDLTQRETTNRSAQFAQALIPRLGAVSPMLTNSHRSAGFFVLLAPDVPAVLVETGFLSNAADERRIADPRARHAMAEAMAGAVEGYFAGPHLYAARA